MTIVDIHSAAAKAMWDDYEVRRRVLPEHTSQPVREWHDLDRTTQRAMRDIVTPVVEAVLTFLITDAQGELDESYDEYESENMRDELQAMEDKVEWLSQYAKRI